MRPGFLWIASNGWIPWCLKRSRLLFSHVVLTLQYGFPFSISLLKALWEGRYGGKNNSRVVFLLSDDYFQANDKTVKCMSLWVEFSQKIHSLVGVRLTDRETSCKPLFTERECSVTHIFPVNSFQNQLVSDVLPQLLSSLNVSLTFVLDCYSTSYWSVISMWFRCAQENIHLNI